MLAVMKEIAGIEIDNGLLFDLDHVQVTAIRDEAAHGGVRVNLLARLHETGIHIQIDIGFGDVAIPLLEPVTFPSLLHEDGPTFRGYRLETVVAEKLESITRLGLINGRLKDDYGLYRLAVCFPEPSPQLEQSIRVTFERRDTGIGPLPEGLGASYFGARDKQELWEAFLRRSELTAPGLPEVCRLLGKVYGPFLERAANLITFEDIQSSKS